MSRYNHKTKLSRKALFYRILVALAAIATVVYFLPREGRSRYQFDLGRPWRYSQLSATFDFPVYKSKETINRERDSLHRLYEPYFELKHSVEEKQLSLFDKACQSTLRNRISPHFIQLIQSRLHTVYSQGIISNDDYSRLQHDSISGLRIYSSKEAAFRTLNDIYTRKSAYEFVTQVQDDFPGDLRFELQQCNLDEYITPNLVFDKTKSDQQFKELEDALSDASGMVLSGQKIIDRGDLVDEEAYNKLISYERKIEERTDVSSANLMILGGQALYVALLVVALLLYFDLFRRDYMTKPRSMLLLVVLTVAFPLLTSALVKLQLLSVFILPYCMIPIFVRVFMDSRTAFIAHVFTVLICAVTLKYPLEFIATQLVAGLTAIYSLRELSQRSQLIQATFFVTVSALCTYLSLDLAHGHTWSDFSWDIYTHIVISGFLLLFAYPLLLVIEKIFGFISNVTLVELSNINNEILRTMSEVAPGTFQHSMQVANLAAEVANRIGAKSQLVRTGALYHDIGKTANPAFFTENQNGMNPHEGLSYVESARIIINHVRDGLVLADKYNLPPVIKAFISTHHGRSLTKYFYISYKNQFPDEEVPEHLFTYPGPNPSTSEQAILMMADAVEAASRSLKEYTEESISTLVDRIIDSQLQDGYFKQCPITFLDIETAKEVFKEKLKIIYHTRVSYPELKPLPEAAGPQTGSTSK